MLTPLIKSLKNLKIFRNFIIILFLFILFNGCAGVKGANQLKSEKYKGIGYLELLCPQYYFYGDVILTAYDNDMEMEIFSFGSPFIKVQDKDGRIKVFYLGSELSNDDINIFPINLTQLKEPLLSYVFDRDVNNTESVYTEIKEGKKFLILSNNSCMLKLFLERER